MLAGPRRRRGALRALLCLTILPLLPLTAEPARAFNTGHIQGRVLDEHGDPLEGALVTVRGEEAVGLWECRTDPSGFYRIAGLDASRDLTIRVEAERRATVERSGYRLRDDQTLRLDFRLRPEGVFYTLVILDRRVPYHRTALAGARGTLPPGLRVFEASRLSPRTIRKLRRALRSHPDGVLAIGSLSARLARTTVRDIPVVYTMVLDPEKEDLRIPNMCGIASNGAFSEQLDILEQMAPGVRTVGTLFDPERMDGVVRRLRDEALGAGYRFEARAVHEEEDFRPGLEQLRDSGVEAFMLLLDPGLWTVDAFHRARAFVQEYDIMMIVPDRSMVQAGATFTYGPGFMELGAYAGRLLTNIVERKVTTSEIGEIFPTTRYFSVNPQDLDRFGLRMPPTLEIRAPASATPRVILEPGS